jgi:hypothetical protein
MKRKEIVHGLGTCDLKFEGEIDCECCKLMKTTRIKFDKGPRLKADGLLDLVHTDICGPIQEQALGGVSYVVTFIDDASRKSDVYTVRNKSEVMDVFKDYKARVENETGRVIKILRSDNGGEYSGNAFEEYLRCHGIKHENTTVYTPQQNGVAERLNRSLLEMTRCLLRESGVPNLFWPEAVRAANVIRNRLTTRICGDKTPYELWTGRKPNIGYFRVFGCKAYVRIPRPYWTGKLGARAERGVFLGYDDRRKASLIWVQGENRMVHSRDVRYVENERGWENIDETGKQEASVSIQIPFEHVEENSNEVSAGLNDSNTTKNTEHVELQESGSIEEISQSGSVESAEESLSSEEEDDIAVQEETPHSYNLRERTLNVNQ